MMVNVNKKNNFAYVIVYQNIDPFGDISILTFYSVREQTQSKGKNSCIGTLEFLVT